MRVESLLRFQTWCFRGRFESSAKDGFARENDGRKGKARIRTLYLLLRPMSKRTTNRYKADNGA